MKFKLQVLLKLRENQEKVKQRELAQAYQEEQLLLKEKEKILHLKSEMLTTARKSSQDCVDIHSIKIVNQYTKVLQTKKLNIEEKEKKNTIKVMEKKEALFEAVKNRKILENLKEMHRLQWLEEQKMLEQQQLDEITSYKYSTRDKEEEDAKTRKGNTDQ